MKGEHYLNGFVCGLGRWWKNGLTCRVYWIPFIPSAWEPNGRGEEQSSNEGAIKGTHISVWY